MNNDKSISRRRFLGEASCAAVGSTALLSSLLQLRMTSTAAAQDAGGDDDYKALVCLFLAGGNDSFNMLVPNNDDAYSEYKATRDNIAIDQANLLPITTGGQNYSEFGIHPSMPELKDLYDSGDVSFVSNVGTLVQPTTKQDYNNKIALPSGLFSHSDQQIHWQTSVPQVKGASPGGWGGRTADLLMAMNEDSQVSMNISLSGVNIFQTGNEAFAYTSGLNGGTEMVNYNQNYFKDAVDDLLSQEYHNLFTRTFAQNTRRFIDSSIVFNEAIEPIDILTPMPPSRLAERFRMVARSIAAQGALNQKRQTFFVRAGGWDHHSEVNDAQTVMLAEVSQAVKYFNDALEEIGMKDKVVTFTASDFGRTLTSNGVGSDHAWGGNHFVMGGPVTGGRIFGQYPSLQLNNSLMLNRARLIPTTSVDEYSSELARWFGVSSGEMDTVFPNIKNFYDPALISHPLGFLS
ncbi:MAG: DUF1501 domain-containing protein [Opitutales bacterium]|nr:DUF1501 domain-containing protein [bacterium]MDG2168869.1 DUF1501 domain-containing protein [Opitutales bacterium]